jgi:hypothetical protein
MDELTFKELCELTMDEFTIYVEAMNSLKREEKGPECECGAKHTSNPKHHLKYCPLNKG